MAGEGARLTRAVERGGKERGQWRGMQTEGEGWARDGPAHWPADFSPSALAKRPNQQDTCVERPPDLRPDGLQKPL